MLSGLYHAFDSTLLNGTYVLENYERLRHNLNIFCLPIAHVLRNNSGNQLCYANYIVNALQSITDEITDNPYLKISLEVAAVCGTAYLLHNRLRQQGRPATAHEATQANEEAYDEDEGLDDLNSRFSRLEIS